MSQFDKIRQSVPSLRNASDAEILRDIAGTTGYNDGDVAKVFGYGQTGGLASNRIGAGIDNYQANLYGLVEAVTGAVGLDGVSKALGRRRQDNEFQANVSSQRASELGGIDDWRDVGGIGSGLNYVGGLAAQSAPYLAESLVGGVAARGLMTGTRAALRGAQTVEAANAARKSLNVGSTIGGVAASYPSAVGDILSNQRDENGTTNLASAAVGGIPYAALNAVGVEGVVARGLRPLSQGGGDLLKRVAITGGTTALTEGASETGQELINQSAGRMSVNPEQTLFNEDANKRYVDSFVGGAALGGVIGGASGVRRPMDNGDLLKPPAPEPEAPPAPTQPPAQLGFDGRAGEIISFPDGSSGLRSELEAQQDFPRREPEPIDPAVQDELDAKAEQDRAVAEKKQAIISEIEQVKQARIAQEQAEQTLAAERTTRAKEFGVELKGKAQLETFGELEAALDAGTIDTKGFAQNMGLLGASKHGEVKKNLEAAAVMQRLVELRSTGVIGDPMFKEAEQDLKDGKVKQVEKFIDGWNGQTAAVNAETTTRTTQPAANPGTAKTAVPAQSAAAGQQPASAPPVAPVQQPVTESPGALSTVQPTTTVTVGRKGREQTLTKAQLTAKMGAATEIDRQRILDALGLEQDADPTTGAPVFLQVAEPRTFGEVAELEAQRTGKKVSKQAISQALLKFGITEDVVNAAVGTTADTVSDAELGIDPAANGSGFRTETQLSKATGQGLVDDGSTPNKKQAAAIEAADAALAAAPAQKTSDRYDPAADESLAKRQAAAQAELEREVAVLVATPEAQLAATDWNDAKFDAAPDFADLPTAAKLEFLVEHRQQTKETGNDWNPIEELVQRLSKEQLDTAPRAPEPAGEPAVRPGAAVRVPKSPGSRVDQAKTKVDPAREAWDKERAAVPQMPAFDTLNERQQKQVADLVSREQFNLAAANTVAGDINQDVLGPDVPLNRDVLESKGTAGTKGSTVADVTTQAKAFLRVDSLGRNVFVVDKLDNLPPEVKKSSLDGTTQGVAIFDGKGGRKVYLIASQIAPGKVKSVFLHEVGAHIGLEQLLSPTEFKALANQIRSWARAAMAAKGRKTTEQKLAIEAFNRAMAAKVTAADIDSEVVAYFIEEAVDAGIDPTASNMVDGPLRPWFRRLWAAFKTAIHKLGIKPESLTARDIVDLAYGAARLEVAGTWHGTAADFRNFNHDYMNTGEGAQAFGWGTYLAQRVGIAKGYLEADVQRKADPGKVAIQLDGKEVISDLGNRNWVEYADALEAQGFRFDESEKVVLSAFMARLVGSYNGDVKAFAENKLTDRMYQRHALGMQRLLNRFSSEVSGVKAPEGNLMRVDAAVTPEEMLDWDAPFASQPEFVQQALRKAMKEAGYEVDALESGGRIYEGIADDFKYDKMGTDGKKDASKLLEKHGIKGIQFLDARSRSRSLADIKRDFLAALPEDADFDEALEAAKSGAFSPEQAAVLDALATDDWLGFDYPAQAISAALGRDLANFDASPALLSAVQSLTNATPATRNLVIFNDKNIQRVASQVGGDKARVKFSKAAPVGIPSLDRAPEMVQNMLQSFKDGSSWVGIRTMFTEDLIALATKVIPSARLYKSAMDKIEVTRGRMERDVVKVLQDFRALPAHEQGKGPGSVNQLLMESTMGREWAFQPDWVTEKVAINPALVARFNGLSAAGQAMVKRVFKHGHETLQQMQAAVQANVASEYDTAIAEATAAGDKAKATKLANKKAKELADFKSMLDMRSAWPYAPLKRFGKHVVMGYSAEYAAAKAANDVKEMQRLQKDGDHYYVAFAETKAQARKMEADIKDSFLGGETGNFEKLDGAESFMGGRDIMGAFQRLRTVFNDGKVEGEAKTNERIDTMMRQMYLTLLSETSARKSEIHRRNVVGADGDMMRAFATQGRATAHFIAGLQTNGKINEHLLQMKAEAGKTLGDREQKQAYFNEIMRRHSMNLEYSPSGMIEKAMAGTSVWMLLTNPSYFLVNMTQPFMMSSPLMGARYGYARAHAEMFKAYREVAPVLKDAKFTEDDYSTLPKDTQRAVEELANMGVIDISLESVLGKFESAQGTWSSKLDPVMERMRGAAQAVESMNRLTTAIAAYRLAGGQSNHDAAVEYAAKVIYETHGDYSGFNAPRLMRRGVGKLATQFRKFQLIQLSMFARLLNTAFKGASADERYIAKKALAFNLAHLGAAGGLMGMPAFSMIAWVIGKALPGDDEPDDPEATLRRLIGDKALADLLLKGAPKLLGVDISGRVGAGGMLSILPYTDLEMSRDGYYAALGGALGPFLGGLAPKVIDGVGLISDGQLWKGTEQLLPTGLANVMKATRFGDQGVTKRNGDVVLSADEVGMLEWAAQAVGLPTNVTTDRSFLANAQFKSDKFYRERTSELKNRYAAAVRKNDTDTMREVREDWMQTQAARRKLGYEVQPLSTLLKAPQEQRKREAATTAGVQTNRSNQGFVAPLQ